MFMARGLTAAEAHLAYPLVSCRYPTLSLALWTNYVSTAERENAPQRLICLVDQRDRRHAILAYGVDRSQPGRTRLRIAHIATFQLIGDAIHRALHRTIEEIATMHDCREVYVEAWTGCDDVASVSKACLSKQAGRVLTLDSTIAPTGVLN
ncbi:MAG: hypothetical protein KDJ20_01850 [Hyphomicrobiales bacterium]|nr:hypothetical protein [Hyphomicrobiales bacterium]MCC2102861.1 hypothetical protein [Hyphomicrobiales bacterium]